MAGWQALVGVALAGAQTVLFVIVGATFLARARGREAPRTARDAMATWWFALALTTAARGLLQLLSTAAPSPLEVAADVTLLNLAALCAGLAGLLYYLTYLATGWTRMLWPIALAYAAVFAWLSQRVAAWNPVGVSTAGWNAQVVYAHPPSGATIGALLLLLVAPELLAALALAAVALRLPPGPSRQRATVLAVGILAWFGSSLAGQVAGTTGGAAWPVAQQLLGMAVAVAVLWVFAASSRNVRGGGMATTARPPVRGDAEP